MDEYRHAVTDFLKQNRMHPDDLDIDSCCRSFLDEMQAGLAGKQSSLQMIPTYIDTEKDIPLNEPVIVMDAGGTHFRVATVHFNNSGEPVIENFKRFAMPGIDREVSKETFFNTMAEYLKHLPDVSKNIGFCFSYATEVQPNKDGKVIRFSKEVKAPQVEGQLIGENLNRALAAAGAAGDKHIVILNDTVTTLVAGKAYYRDRAFDGYVGFILGTGTNCCYIEKNKNITKAKDLEPDKTQIINVESGGFGKAPRGQIDVEFDKTTVDAGAAKFEKMISGAYLGPLCLLTIKTAADAGLFSKNLAGPLDATEQLETKDVSDFLYYPHLDSNPLGRAAKNCEHADRVKLYLLLDSLVERAAKLTAANLSAATLKSGKGADPTLPVCIVAEGTTFYQLKSLKSRVEYYLKQYLEDAKHRYVEPARIENATLLGAAIAGLTN